MKLHTQSGQLLITHCEDKDLNFIYSLFEKAIAYHKKNDYPVWKGYDREVLDKDRAEKRQYKILIEGEIAFLFSVCYSDEIIWRERNKDAALYLHRMVVNPKFKGRRLVNQALEWAKQECANKRLHLIRMDTWADNPKIIAYYESFGFKVVGHFSTPNSPDLPIQQRGNEIVLLEYVIEDAL